MANPLPKAKELRAAAGAELQQQLQSLRKDVWQHRQRLREGAERQSHLVVLARRQIARIETILREQRAKTPKP